MTQDPLQQVQHLLISGRVQGVGFRWFARERARRRGLRGWVVNRSDGSVELKVAGSDVVIADFVAELRRGPEGAVVASIRELGIDAAEGETLPHPFQIMKQLPP